MHDLERGRPYPLVNLRHDLRHAFTRTDYDLWLLRSNSREPFDCCCKLPLTVCTVIWRIDQYAVKRTLQHSWQLQWLLKVVLDKLFKDFKPLIKLKELYPRCFFQIMLTCSAVNIKDV